MMPWSAAGRKRRRRGIGRMPSEREERERKTNVWSARGWVGDCSVSRRAVLASKGPEWIVVSDCLEYVLPDTRTRWWKGKSWRDALAHIARVSILAGAHRGRLTALIMYSNAKTKNSGNM